MVSGRLLGLSLIALLVLNFAGAPLAVAEDTEKPSYVDLEPAFTLNYGDPTKTHYFQAAITLKARDSVAALEISAHSDAIRHRIIMVFSRQPAENIRSASGRDSILEQTLYELQQLMMEETGSAMVDRVLFTSFFVQS